MSVHQRPDSRSWFVSWREDGKPKRRVFGKGTEAEKQARAFDHEVKAKKLRGQSIEDIVAEVVCTAHDVYIDALAQAYVDMKKAEGLSLKGLKEFAAFINNVIAPEFGHRPVETWTELQLVTFMGQHYAGREPITRNRYLSYLKVLFNFGMRHLGLKANPLANWRKTKEKPRQCLLTVEDLAKIMAVAPEHLRRAITLGFLTAMRPGASEMLALRAEHVDLERRTVKIYATKTKTWREVDIPEAYVETFRQWCADSKSGHLIEYRGKAMKKFRRSFKSALKKAGIEKDSVMYELRHLSASTMIQAGVEPGAVSQILGHSTVAMTVDTYYHAYAGAKKQAVQGLAAKLTAAMVGRV